MPLSKPIYIEILPTPTSHLASLDRITIHLVTRIKMWRRKARKTNKRDDKTPVDRNKEMS